MRINYNVSAMLSNNALANNDNLLAQSLERLSSGLKINHAKDNPAGLAMAKRMNAQIEGLSQANDNANDGISVIETADGAMSEISEMLQRMNELAIKSANGTMSESDRSTVQDEISQLKAEITRVAETTEFNGQKLLNGEFELKGYVYGDIDVKVAGYSMDVPAKDYYISEIKLQKEMVKAPVKDEKGNMFDKDGNLVNGDPDKAVMEDVWTGDYLAEITVPADSGFPDGFTAKMTKDNLLTISGTNGFEMTLDLSELNQDKEAKPSMSAQKKFEDLLPGQELVYTPKDKDGKDITLRIDATGIGAMRLQIGANEGQVLPVEIPAISLRNMGIENLDVSTKEGSLKGIEDIDGALKYVSKVRGMLGAYQNRLESTVDSLDVTSENMTAAYSRIMDVDMAEEMTNYTTYQVLTQAGTSMLAQANERPSQVLQLLQ
ncbi:MAG: flagellin FliC3 [Butyrivibrio sp.]|nr:flagellin FliC3 [Acetatifactor muris]MCM1559521.1 flagellin FliC3 [Butyrivibrio sp.]